MSQPAQWAAGAEPDERSDLHHYFTALRRRLWVVLLLAFVTAAAAGAMSFTKTKQYEAQADVLIGRTAASLTNSGQAADGTRTVETEVQVLKSRAVLDAAIERLGHAPAVRITSSTNSDVVSVIARSPDPRVAALDADAYAAAYVDYRLRTNVRTIIKAGQEVDDQLAKVQADLTGDLTPIQRKTLESQEAYLVEQRGQLELAAGLANAGGASVLARAEVPGVPVSPKPKQDIAIGLALGLVLGIAVALLLDYLDDTIETRADLELALAGAAPVLAEVPDLSPPKKRKRHHGREALLFVEDQPTAIATENIGILRTSLLFLGVDRPMTTIQVTSPTAAEGKSTLSTNLALSIANSGKRVIVLDLDLRRPMVHKFFDAANTVGFTSVVLGDATVEQALQRYRTDVALAFMPSGKVPPNPSELLTSVRARDIVGAVSAIADVVIIDSPPVLPVADSLTIARMVDMTILVVRGERSSRRAVRRAIEMLGGVGAPLVGAVLNAVSPESSRYGYKYRYGYRYRYYTDHRTDDGNGNGNGNGDGGRKRAKGNGSHRSGSPESAEPVSAAAAGNGDAVGLDSSVEAWIRMEER